MDRSWVSLYRLSDEYKAGLRVFINNAVRLKARNGHILCPCRGCSNRYLRLPDEVFNHVIIEGMDRRYQSASWENHGDGLRAEVNSEPVSIDPPEETFAHTLLNDIYGDEFRVEGDDEFPNPSHPPPTEGTTPYAEHFYNLVAEADKELYPGCSNYKKLEFIVELFQLKTLNGMTNKCFSDLLAMLRKALPEGETLPKSFYQTKKLIATLGLTYEKIHACPNDCMLYWQDTAQSTSCQKCGASRWKDPLKKVPAKVFRYFPLTPRLQRLYMSKHTANHMRWHDIERTKDGALRHPADSAAWKSLDDRHPDFAIESRNVRLGLASDGFNPFGNMSTAHSTWPVIIVVYNLPPWMCMKQPYLLMSSLIPGPKGPGNDIDVYLQPLIHELKELWDIGVSSYDVSLNQTFTLRAALLWTINDFPAYATLSGWSTKGRYACPQCNLKTCSKYLLKGRKFCYMGHRRFLPPNHHYRRQKNSFNLKTEMDPPPTFMSGSKCLEQLEGLTFSFGKPPEPPPGSKNRTRVLPRAGPWKKKSIFFDLPYWEHHLLRHNLDVMHIEKNICDSVVGTLLDIKGKTKDGPKARDDMKLLNIKPHLHPVMVGSNKRLPPGSFTLNKAKKRLFCNVLRNVRVPDGYASNLSRCVNLVTTSISGWKSHDCHVVMHHLLPLAMRHVLPRNVMAALKELSAFFKALCRKNATPADFEILSKKIALALCDMEKIFPPAFFDVMVHLPVHLAYEASIAGPVQYRWMYPIERYLHNLKGYVKNMSRPEGCIAEGYLLEECLSFCSMYLEDTDSRRTRRGRNTDKGGRSILDGLPIFGATGESLGKSEHIQLDGNDWNRARRYVLFNCAEVQPFIAEHFQILKDRHKRKTHLELERMQKDSFAFWFHDRVNTLYNIDPNSVTEDLRFLAIGPEKWVRRYKKYVVNGFRFRVKADDYSGPSQNSGVFMTAQTSSYSSVRDQAPVQSNVDYYGVLNDVIELSYYGDRKVVLFQCEWVDGSIARRAIKTDEFGFKLVNLKKTQTIDDNFILASQALQVFYVQDQIDNDWHVPVKTSPRDYFDLNEVIC